MPPKKQIKLATAKPKPTKFQEPEESSSDREIEDDAVIGKLSDVDSDLEDMDGDDEFSGVEDIENEDLEESEESKPKKGSSDSFAVAMTKILGSNLKGSDRKKQPILARSKGAERKIEDEKLEYKARKLLSAEKKALASKDRVIPDYTTMDYEKKLRKVATRGVVKLFNAIRTQQKVTDVAVDRAASTSKTSRAIEKAKNVSTMPKSSFLELLKTGTS
ncbi:hypothetical protein INT43_008057 [Umbelopsis isabellina]|uniref:Rrp15p-domain-containing protein n=1 Tax=Mortierella isabellina TaxID=91625 RepID=A0A8H7PD34_MORIS|nr:hypothetical protein INT43_008057 [Umbelopsis isabellina]